MSVRRARIERAKALGRAAYRLALNAEIIGNVDLEGEEKRLTEFYCGQLSIELWRPWRTGAFETEFSRSHVSCAGENVLELRWDRTDPFQVVLFKQGEWETSID